MWLLKAVSATSRKNSEKNFWESNPEQLVENRKHYLCAPRPPILAFFDHKQVVTWKSKLTNTLSGSTQFYTEHKKPGRDNWTWWGGCKFQLLQPQPRLCQPQLSTVSTARATSSSTWTFRCSAPLLSCRPSSHLSRHLLAPLPSWPPQCNRCLRAMQYPDQTTIHSRGLMEDQLHQVYSRRDYSYRPLDYRPQDYRPQDYRRRLGGLQTLLSYSQLLSVININQHLLSLQARVYQQLLQHSFLQVVLPMSRYLVSLTS